MQCSYTQNGVVVRGEAVLVAPDGYFNNGQYKGVLHSSQGFKAWPELCYWCTSKGNAWDSAAS